MTCANGTLANHSSATLAAEIYGGTRKYINHEVIVSSRVGGYTEQIFQGRLKDVKINGVDTISMTIAVHDPIKDISIPIIGINAFESSSLAKIKIVLRYLEKKIELIS